MGTYLRTPSTEDRENETIKYGLSATQGCRSHMEDAVFDDMFDSIEARLQLPGECRVVRLFSDYMLCFYEVSTVYGMQLIWIWTLSHLSLVFMMAMQLSLLEMDISLKIFSSFI
ncbi:hypothetical protein RHGRI_035152 [Rhododendron griersonianum]|uniref:Uncharacterized protein n=1 Tax=Rhododendron griersonianum TaxID=479676 RepID=A0AAV6I3U8_9ERIC|nr:hypothetical protein RHGRI_035152 [Rhododendron griersonianum]